MKQQQSQGVNRLARYIIIIAAAAIVVFLAWYFSNILTYILIAAVLSIIGRPMVNFFDNIKIWKFKIPHWLSATLSLAIIFLVAFIIVYIFIPLIGAQIKEMSHVNFSKVAQNLSEPLNGIEEKIRANLPNAENFSFADLFSEKINSYIQPTNLTSLFGSVADTLVSFGIGIFCVFFITFFFLKEDSLFSEGVIMLFPKKYEPNIKRAMASVNNLLIRYFVGILIEIICVAILLMAGLSLIAGIDFSTAVVIAILAGILNVIPYVGPLIGYVFGVVIAAASDPVFISTGSVSIVIPVLLVMIAVQLIDNMLFQPIIYSNSVKSHPLEIFIVLLVAGNIGGILGMLVAIPAYTVLRVFAKEFFYNFRFVQKLTENI